MRSAGTPGKDLKSAMELNYTPNKAARSLRTGEEDSEHKIYYISVLMTRMDNATTDPFFSELLRVIESEYINRSRS